jgi:hypothetical protein
MCVMKRALAVSKILREGAMGKAGQAMRLWLLRVVDLGWTTTERMGVMGVTHGCAVRGTADPKYAQRHQTSRGGDQRRRTVGGHPGRRNLGGGGPVQIVAAASAGHAHASKLPLLPCGPVSLILGCFLLLIESRCWLVQDLPENLLAAVLEGNDTLNIILFKWEVPPHSLPLISCRSDSTRKS